MLLEPYATNDITNNVENFLACTGSSYATLMWFPVLNYDSNEHGDWKRWK